MKRLLNLLLALALAAPAGAQSADLQEARRRIEGVAQVVPFGVPARLQAAPPPAAGARELPPVQLQLLPQQNWGLTDEQLETIWAISGQIRRLYVEPVDRQKLFYGAMRGMAKELDQHTQFLDPTEAKRFRQAMSGSFSGIGARLKTKEDGKPMQIQMPLPGSPAERAGVKSGDEIMKVGNAETAPLDADKVIELIQGPAGTPVTLELRRLDPRTQRPTTVTVTIIRATVKLDNLLAKLIPGTTKGYIYFAQFQGDTDTELFKAIRALKSQGMTELILDMRFNGGGRLDTAIRICEGLLAKDKIIVSEKARPGSPAPGNEAKTGKDGEFKDLPLKLLVNGGSASASEVLAGALQDHQRARIVGTQTYGKGSVQIPLDFADGSMFKITIQRWYTPNGRSIDKTLANAKGGGLTPDDVVAVGEKEDAEAVGRVLKELNGAPDLGPVVPDPILEQALK
ncbi:MAG: S41 family peptidase [Elusimicrobia bacterium]|nr:S41 family peptidase [Elusimicrobiota bacterium]